MQEDLSLSLTETVSDLAGHARRTGSWAMTKILAPLTPVIEWSKELALPMRARIVSRQILWSLVVALEAISPALATGQSTAPLNPVRIETSQRSTGDGLLQNQCVRETSPARFKETER